ADRPLLVAYIALQRHGHRIVNNYSAGTGGGSQIECSLVRKLKLNVARSGLYVPITFLHAINANVSASRLGSHRAIDLMQFNIPRAGMDANVTAAFRLHADVSAAGLCRQWT